MLLMPLLAVASELNSVKKRVDIVVPDSGTLYNRMMEKGKAEAQFAFTNYRRYYREARERVADEKTEAVGKLRDYFSVIPIGP